MIPIVRPSLPPLPEYVASLEQIWSTRMLSNFGSSATALEAMTAEYLQVPNVLTCVSGDIALTLAIRALELAPGTPVLVPSFTFNSTVNAVIWNGLRPVFVDIDPDSFTMSAPDAATVAAGAGAIIATHVFGNPCDVDALAGVARDHGLRLLFDSAHGYGSLRDGVHVGALGDAEIFSLSGTKPVTCAEGGLFATADEELAERFRYLRGYGFRYDYNSVYVGLNGKMSELHAALGLLTLARIEDALAARSVHVEAYRRRLGRLPGIAFQAIRPEDRSTYKDMALLFDTPVARARVEAALAAADVQTKRYFRPCHQMDAFRGYATRPLPITESVADRILCVPLFEGLTPAEHDLICSTIETAVATADRPRTATSPRRRSGRRSSEAVSPGVR